MSTNSSKKISDVDAMTTGDQIKKPDILVCNTVLADHLGLSLTSDELTALLVRWGVLVVDYTNLPGGCVEFINIHPTYRLYNLGSGQDHGDGAPLWYWNQRGCRAVKAMFKQLRFPDYRKIAKIIVNDALNPDLEARDAKLCKETENLAAVTQVEF